MTQNELENTLHSMTDRKLIEEATFQLNNLCKTGARSFTMSVPVKPTDTDMIFGELIRRFEEKALTK